MKRFALFFVSIALIMLGAGCQKQAATVQNVNSCVATAGSINYPGQEGKNALELLQVKYQVDVSSEGFVNAIDGRKPGAKEYWAFYVNCQSASVGAADYQTKAGDLIEWRLEAF